MNINRIFYEGNIYHIFNKSISNYQIFRSDSLASHYKTTLNYYNSVTKKLCFSKALKKPLKLPHIINRGSGNIVFLLAYCIMPDHYHLLLNVKDESLISKYISNVQNSYTHYYNKINNRQGPLWQNRFRSVYIHNNVTFLHVLRYIHLNPTTAEIVNLPEKWKWSSYADYISHPEILKMNREISIRSIPLLRRFTEDQISYQKTIKGIRRQLHE